MGAVFECVDAEGVTRAAKLMRPEIAGQTSFAVQSFVNEARAAESLRSPHIVSVLDGGMDETLQIPYLVMELLHGFDAEQLLERVGPLDPTTAARIIVQAAHGITTAHTAGIIHRDI